jgi:hypothetical protein
MQDMSFDGWIDARDGETLAREWATVNAKSVAIGEARWLSIKPTAVAVLAANFLGSSPDCFAWFAAEPWESEKLPPPTFSVGREVSRCTFEGVVHVPHECGEVWKIRELVEGPRGVQHIDLQYHWGEYTRDGGNGGGLTVVRLYDRSTAQGVSIRLSGQDVWVIGEPLDLSALDLFSQRTELRLPWKRYDPDAILGLVARLAADLDAHFDTAPAWPGGLVSDEVVGTDTRVRRREYRYASGGYAIEMSDFRYPEDLPEGTGRMNTRIEGLPWGHQVCPRLEGSDDPVWGMKGSLDLTLPRAQLDATIARLAAIPGIELT